MKANLMFRDRDFDITATPRFGRDMLTADLELERVLAFMAQGDGVIGAACTSALFCPLQLPEQIRYRQENLRDAFRNPDALRRLYEITVEAGNKKRSAWHWLSSRYISATFNSAVELMKIFLDMLMELRLVADKSLSGFQSEGFGNLLTMLRRELDDAYFAEARAHLNDLKDGAGTLISAEAGDYLHGVRYVLRRKKRKGFLRRWSFVPSYTVAPRDDEGVADLAKRRDRAINEVTNALAQAAEHLEGFFTMLRGELAFYVGCLNLADYLRALGLPVCIPELLEKDGESRSWRGLYDVSLVLTKQAAVTANDLDADGKSLYIITGANQGGKTTFLRSVGQAQLMAQSGMFVGAESFCAPVRSGVFTHFKREEDSEMKSGKLDEELARMSEIIDSFESGAVMLFNESFAATNEREGSEICSQITRALIENGTEVFSVTHLYTHAAEFLNDRRAQFLQAERLDGGERTFKVVPGLPRQTAFGEDLYKKVFG